MAVGLERKIVYEQNAAFWRASFSEPSFVCVRGAVVRVSLFSFTLITLAGTSGFCGSKNCTSCPSGGEILRNAKAENWEMLGKLTIPNDHPGSAISRSFWRLNFIYGRDVLLRRGLMFPHNL